METKYRLILIGAYLAIAIVAVFVPYFGAYDESHYGRPDIAALVWTNLFIIPSVVWAFWYERWNLWLELVSATMLFLFSSWYHLCGGDRQTCWGDFQTLQRGDFIFATHCISCGVIYLFWIRGDSWQAKLLVHIPSFLGVVYFVIETSSLFARLVPSLVIACLGIGYVLYMKEYKKERYEKYVKSIDWVDFGITVVLIIIAVVFMIIGDSDPSRYPVFHSLWHVAIMLSFYFTFEIRERAMYAIFFCRDEEDTKKEEYELQSEV